MNKAILGNFFKIWVSISLPGRVLPRNMGGLPMMTALGYSLLVIVATNSSKSLQTLVFSYADLTKLEHFCWRTAVARSVAGSTRATTFNLGPSLLKEDETRTRDAFNRSAYCSRRKE